MNKAKIFVIIAIILSLLVIILFFSRRITNTRNEIGELKTEIHDARLRLERSYKRENKITTPIYYINLEHRTDRRTSIEKQLKDYNITNAVRVSAVNGSMINTLNSGIANNIEFRNDYNDLDSNQIGCTLSHLLAIQTAFNNGDDISIIMEDDCDFSLIPHWIHSIEEMIQSAPNDWEILQTFSTNIPMDRLSSNCKYILYDSFKPAYSTVCYIINRKGMNTILNFTKTINTQGTPIYHLKNIPSGEPNKSGVADIYIYAIAKTYIIQPYLFIPIVKLPSSICVNCPQAILDVTNTINDVYLKYLSYYLSHPQL